MPEEDRYQHYQVLKRADGSLWELGHGAMGITYKAYDTNLRCPVALKVINATYLQNEKARQRFLREARAAAALRQQNVASVFHLGTDHGTFFYAMEFVDGQTVDEYIKRKGRLTPLEALNIASQVARALAAAARQHLVHRDLKPANLMLVDEDGEKVVKVIDFGLAKSAKRGGADSGSLTEGGGFVGTPHFASPEQLEDRDLDVRSDIYSLGTTLYYLVTGRPPFSGSLAQIMSQHLYKPVPVEPLQGFSSPLVDLVLWMMEKDRDERPQGATELRRAIQQCIRELGVTDLSASASDVVRALPPDAMPTVAASAASEAAVEAGSVFARMYRVDQPLPNHVAGKRYRGIDLERRLTVSLLVLSREFLADAPHSSALERAVDQVRNAPHPGLRQVIALVTAGGQTVLVEEFLSAPSLQDILRVRGRLPAAEVVAVLERLAPVADHARLKGLEHVDFTLGGIQLADPAQNRDAAGLEQWIQQPLAEWPDLTPRVAPIDFVFQASDLPHWAGEATVVQPSGPFARSKGSYVQQLSLLAYELLGGPRGPLETQGRYVPIAALPEGGNQVLRRGLADECPSAGELARQMAAAADFESARRVTPGPLPQIVPVETPAQRSSKRRPKAGAWSLGLALGLLACVGIAGYALYQSQVPRPSPADGKTPARIVLALPQDPIQSLRDEAKRNEKGSPEYLRAYVRLVQALTLRGAPNSQEYSELGQTIEGLRSNVPPVSKDEFRLSYQSSIEDAANLNILPAIVWLAENEKGPEAFDLFLRAATRGDSYAMMKVGRLYFTKGTLSDDKEGFDWLNRSYTDPKPNLEAGAYLGDCYLSGRGTKRDVQKAEEIVMPLANQAVVPAMVLAGRILQYKAEDKMAEALRSTGSLKQMLAAQAGELYAQARPWWERAAEKGDWNAAAHLGQLYERGFGEVKRSEEKAEQLYKAGVDHHNALSMYLYGLLISEKPGRRTEAVNWIKQAATAGIPSAREWLRTHASNLSEVTTQEEGR